MPEDKKPKGVATSDACPRRARGEVTLTFVDKGRVVKTIKQNLVVDQMYNLIAQWAANDFSEYISQIAVGTGGHVPGDKTIPVRPTESDTSLEAELAKKTIATITQPAVNQVEFTVTFLSGEATGDLTEAGLLSSNDLLVARVTFGVISKGAMTLIVRWKITY